MKAVSIIASLACIVFVGLVTAVAWRDQTAVSDDDIPRGAVETADLMHAKLTSSQLVLIGLVGRDMNVVHAGGQELVDLAKSAAWMEATSDPVYAHFNTEFQRLSERIVRMSLSNNADGAAFAYQSLTTTCIACHEHVRDVSRLSTEREE